MTEQQLKDINYFEDRLNRELKGLKDEYKKKEFDLKSYYAEQIREVENQGVNDEEK